MNLAIWTGLCALLLVQPENNAAEEITKEYIDKFAAGVQDLINSSQENVFKDETFDPLKYDEKEAFKNAEEYDFIIVGAGASGAVIANRLSEIPEWKILILEAGSPETDYTQVPSLSGVLQGSKYNWGYLTEPQESWCLGMIDKQCTVPTGKALGGATSINGMIYTRGNPRDYDLWADQGNPGWCYSDVLPYFKKAEDCALKEFDRRFHHQGGPLHVEETQYAFPLIDAFLSAGKELGYKVVDYNGKEQIGFSKTQAVTKLGKRHSAAQAYLLPYANRRNLHIKPLSHVIQIVINPHTKEATGVKYIHNNNMYIAKADKEVIVSAGPYNSAQLLILSGIGPQEDLEKLHIPVLKNLQVGKKLKDHSGFQGLNFVLNISKFNEGTFQDQIATWLKVRKGPLATAGGSALAYVKTSVSKDQAFYPDIELILSKAAFPKNFRIKEEYRPIMEPVGDYATFRIGVMPTHPKSVGYLKLKSKDPFHGPVINANQFTDPDGRDIATMVAGIKKAIEITKTSEFRKLGAHLVSEPVKECDHFGFASDNYWKCAARYLSISLRHQTGTCRMGPPSDKYAVVDKKLRVYGIHKLRVADSSIIPVDITGHTHAPSTMVGEKAADLIKEHWI